MSEDEKDSKKITDLMKKVVQTGLGAAFMTEDVVKNALSEIPISKDALTGIINNAKNSKEEFVQSVKSELKSYLKGIDLSQEIDRILEKYDIEVSAKLNFKKKEEESKDS